MNHCQGVTDSGDHERARQAVLQRMSEFEPRMSTATLAQRAKVNRETVRKFLKDQWPHQSTRAAIEGALGWEPGTLERLAAGEAAPTTDAVPDGVGDLLDWPDGLVDGMTEPKRRLWETEVRAYAMRRALELKGEL